MDPNKTGFRRSLLRLYVSDLEQEVKRKNIFWRWRPVVAAWRFCGNYITQLDGISISSRPSIIKGNLQLKSIVQGKVACFCIPPHTHSMKPFPKIFKQ